MTEKGYGILGTLIVHNIILLILLFAFFVIPNPSPSEGAILINFGETESAGGNSEPQLNEVPEAQQSSTPVEQAAQPEEEEGILTQDFEDAPVVRPQSGNTATERRPVTNRPQTQPVTPEEPVERTPEVNPRALYTNRGTSTAESGTSEGIYQGPGNMGSQQGSSQSDDYTEGLAGSSIAFNLSGRNPLFLQKPDFSVYTEGIIVVEITVDRNGNVINATPGVKGSTLVDNVLYTAAKKAALESKFNIRNDAPERQVGTITYHFKLQ